MSGRFTPRLSVRLRTTLAATAIVAIALGVAAAVLVTVLRDSLHDSAEAEVVRRANTAVAEYSVSGQIQLSSDPDLRIIQPPAQATGGPAEFAAGAAPGTPVEKGGFLQYSAPVGTADPKATIVARVSLEPARIALNTLTAVLIPGIPLLLLLVAALTWIAVGRALAPVAAIRREMADITATDLHRRVPVTAAGDEVTLLAETTNRTLDRLEKSVDQQKRFVADAAHELRSPLAILRTRLELAPSQPLTAEALADVDRIQSLAADLLLLARLDAGELPEPKEVDLGQVVAEEAARGRGRADVRVELRIGHGVVVMGTADQLRRLVANLVDNAVRHAAAAVVVTLRACGTDGVLDVDDDGPGIPVERREAVFDRFTRLDEARARDGGGSGLGLAIARDIATRHDGTLSVDGPPGCHLRLRLPLTSVTDRAGAVAAG